MDRLSPAHFDFLDIVGQGSFGRVVRSRKKDTNQIYAIKVVEKRLLKKEGKVKQAHIEKNVLARLKSHPGVIRLHYTFQDQQCLYFVLEYCPGRDLSTLINRFGPQFPYELAVFYTAEIVSVLEYLHSHQVIHRDLKPENLLLAADGHLKLVDFGSARDGVDEEEKGTADHRKSTFVGTAEYVAPEVLDDATITPAVDLWALGCIVYHMITGNPPFRAQNEYLIFEQIRALDVLYPETMYPQAVDLVQKLLVVCPEGRLGAGVPGSLNDYNALKRHPFFESVDVENVYTMRVPGHVPQKPEEIDLDDDLEIQLLNKEPRVATALILSDVVKKKAGWVYKQRRLTITSEPSIRYFDPSTEQLKGEIEITEGVMVEVKSKQDFHILTPKRTYYFRDIGNDPQRWVTAVDAAVARLKKHV